MLQIDINPTINRIVKILFRVGIWREWQGTALSKRIIKGLYMLTFLLVDLFLATCAFISEDKNEFTFLSVVVVIVTVIGIKLVFLVLKEDEILNFLNSTTEHREYMNQEQIKRMNFLLNFINGYIGTLFISLVFYNTSCLPWLTTDKKLPFFIRFRWNGAHSEIVYWLCYVFVGSGIAYMNVSNLCTYIIWYLMLNFAVGYEILGDKMRKLGTHQTKRVQLKSMGNKKFVQDLIDLVKAHRNLFKTIGQFRSCFFLLFFMQITTSGTSICVSTYNLAFNSENNFFQTTIYVVVMLFAFFDIFLVMYLGNEIKMASNRLSYCLFESNWMEQPAVYNKYAIILGEGLKKPHELIIFIYPINLTTFTMIIKGAYTLFNLLQTLD